jgi:hypothetical protein
MPFCMSGNLLMMFNSKSHGSHVDSSTRAVSNSSSVDELLDVVERGLRR